MNSEELLLSLPLSLTTALFAACLLSAPLWPLTSSSSTLLPQVAERSSSAVRSGLPSVRKAHSQNSVDRQYFFTHCCGQKMMSANTHS